MATLTTQTVTDAPGIAAGPIDFPLAPERTALLVIDMQKEFLISGGYLEEMGYTTEHLRKPIEPIGRLLDTIRGTDILTIFTRYGKRPDLSDEPPNDLGRFQAARRAGVDGAAIFGEAAGLGRMCIRGDLGWQIIDEIQPLEGEPIIEKTTKSSFRYTDLELILRSQGRDLLLITGITTDVCVTTTMRDGNDLGFGCCMVTDCCASADPVIHNNQVDQLPIQAGIFGWWTQSGDVIRALDQAGVVVPEDKRPKRTPKDPSTYW